MLDGTSNDKSWINAFLCDARCIGKPRSVDGCCGHASVRGGGSEESANWPGARPPRLSFRI